MWLALFVTGCGGSSVRWRSGWSSAYSRFSDEARDRFVHARALLDSGRRMEALTELRGLASSDPDNLEIGAWLQDLEGDLLVDGEDLFAGTHSLAAESAPDVLRRVYSTRKDNEPTVTSFVLAARAETDVMSVETLLGKALALDPTCAWAHYGRSHVLLMDRTRPDRWGQAGDALERALLLDPGHLRARRLEAWMRAEEGSRDKAARNLQRWIELTVDDPRVSIEDAVQARIDLALLFLLDGDDGRAERLLQDLEGQEIGRARRLTLLAVARQEAGDELGALDAALRAQGAERGAALPLMQEALLHELFLGDPKTAEARWRAVAELADGTKQIADLVRGLRARVRLERIDRAATDRVPSPAE
ncbi:MAG: hypothetical protein ACJAZN_002545 [Planctomycetota bacterium]